MQQVGWHPDVGLLFPKSVVKELWLDIWGAIFVIIFFNHNPFTKLRSNKTDRRPSLAKYAGGDPVLWMLCTAQKSGRNRPLGQEAATEAFVCVTLRPL